MKVKGHAWLARCEVMERELGAEAWQAFLRQHARDYTFLRAPVMPVSRLDVGEFLSLHDKLVAEFYGGDEHSYWRFGEASGEWALNHQLRGLFSPGEGRRFLSFVPQVYRSYFDGGEALLEETAGYLDVTLLGTPPHLYFEYATMGFAAGALRALQVSVTPQCLKGFSRGDDEVRYRFAVPR